MGGSGALWLEFGVFRGLSSNITSKYRDLVAPNDFVDGFDTFTGLPEAWPNGKGGFYFKKGSFSWAARNLGATPPVRRGVRLHTGLFNETLPGFMQRDDVRGKPVAWANVDCDLYAGALDALAHVGGHLRLGSRLHFHELYKDVKHLVARFLKSRRPPLAPSGEMRALYEWLALHPRAKLQLGNVVSQTNSDAAVFIALGDPV